MTIVNLSNISDISIFVIVCGAAMLYFGKIIGDTRVEKYEKYSYYIEGLFFLLIYVLVPTALILRIIQRLNFTLPRLWSILIQILVPFILLPIARAHELFRRLGLGKEFKIRFNNEVNKLAKKFSIIKWCDSKFRINCSQLTYVLLIKYLSDSRLLFFFSSLVIFSLTSIIYSNESNPAFLMLSFTLALFSLSFVALIHGYNTTYYPPAKLYLKDGQIIKGRLIKFGDFIYLINNDEKIFVNKNTVNMIKENIWKDKKVK